MPGLKRIIETLKQVKYSRVQPKFCPKCKSHNIYPKPNYGIYPETYACRDCDYEGQLVIELEPEDESPPNEADRSGSGSFERDLNKL